MSGDNLPEILFYGAPSSILLKNTPESFVGGMLMAVAFKAPGIGLDIYSGFTSSATISDYKENVKKITELTNKLKDKKLDSESRNIVSKTLVGLIEDNNIIVSNIVSNFDSMPTLKKKEVVDLKLEQDSNNEEIDKINRNKAGLFTEEEKKYYIGLYQEKNNKIVKKQQTILKKYGKERTAAEIIKSKNYINKQINTVVDLAKKIYGSEVLVRPHENKESLIVDYADELSKEEFARLKEKKEKKEKRELTSEEIKSIKKEALSFAQESILKDEAWRANGFNFEPVHGENKGKSILYINKEVAATYGAINVAAHEFLHKILRATLVTNSENAGRLSESLHKFLNEKIDFDNLNNNSKLKILWNGYKKKAYTDNKEIKNKMEDAINKEAELHKKDNFTDNDRQEIQDIQEKIIEYKASIAKNNMDAAEELMTLLSDAMVEGSIVIPKNLLEELGDIIRRFFQDLGWKNIKFNEGEDVYNFIKDYNKVIEKGSISERGPIYTLAKEGGSGELIGKKTTGTR